MEKSYSILYNIVNRSILCLIEYKLWYANNRIMIQSVTLFEVFLIGDLIIRLIHGRLKKDDRIM